MKAIEIRNKFLEFFKKHNNNIIPKLEKLVNILYLKITYKSIQIKDLLR